METFDAFWCCLMCCRVRIDFSAMIFRKVAIIFSFCRRKDDGMISLNVGTLFIECPRKETDSDWWWNPRLILWLDRGLSWCLTGFSNFLLSYLRFEILSRRVGIFWCYPWWMVYHRRRVLHWSRLPMRYLHTKLQIYVTISPSTSLRFRILS